MQQKTNEFIYYNDILKNWKLNLSETGLRRFLLYVSDDLRAKSKNTDNNEEDSKLINKICFLEVIFN